MQIKLLGEIRWFSKKNTSIDEIQTDSKKAFAMKYKYFIAKKN